MGFKKLEQRAKTGASHLPASIKIRGKVRPSVVVRFTKEFTDSLGALATNIFDVLVGHDEDAGKLRLRAAFGVGIVEPRYLRGAMVLDLGYVPEIGDRSSECIRTAARVIDEECIEIDIPDLYAVAADDEDGDEGGDDEDGEEATAADADPAQEANASVLIDGIAFVLTDGEASIAHRDQMVKVTRRQARLVYLLARARAAMRRTTILNALWDGKPPSHSDDTLTMIVKEMGPVLEPLKLAIAEKGSGYKLERL